MPSGTRPLPGPLSKAVARILRDAIDRTGQSQVDIARISGISTSQLSRALNAQKVLSIEELDLICTALELDIVQVITDADQDASDAQQRNHLHVVRDTPTQPPFEVDELRGVAYDQSEGEVGDVEEP